MQSARVYSYLRFSDPKQASGSSIDRQIAYAIRWASEHGMALDETLSLRDEGLSAYHQKHITQGALGAFMAAVEEGRIASGSVLVVEGLDRLSRAEPIQAQGQLAQIINAGITVVTASDGKEYNRERLKANPMDLVYSLLVMIRAHEESDTKSKRVKAAIRRQCERWIDGSWRGIVRNGKDPAWVIEDEGKFVLHPERSAAMREAIDLFVDGYGAAKVLQTMIKRGHSPDHLPTAAATFYKILRRTDLIGTKVLSIGGEEFSLAGYYPALLTQDQFNRLQLANNDRTKRKGKGDIPGIITGMEITRCGYCGGALVGQNLMQRMRDDGTLADGHRRLICANYSHAIGCDVGGSCSVVPVESALLSFCSDQFNLASLQGGGDQSAQIRERLTITRAKIAEQEKSLERITDAMLAAADDGGATPITFIRRARDLETELANLRKQESVIEAELSQAGRASTPAMAEAWASIVEGTQRMDYEARMKARKLVKDTFERIVIYHHGIPPDSKRSTPIDMVLVPRNGTPRRLQVNRQTGEWLASDDG